MRVDRVVRSAFVAGCATLVVGGVGFRVALAQLQVYLKKEPVPLREPLDTLPAKLGRWKQVGKDTTFSDALIEELGPRNYLDRFYAIDGVAEKGIVEVHAAYYTGMVDTVPHIPERCWGAGGLVQLGDIVTMPLAIAGLGEPAADAPENRATGLRYPMATVTDPVTRRSEPVALPVGEMAMTLTTFQDPKASRLVQFGGYFFIANGRCTPSTFGVRALAFNLTDRYAYYCKVQLSGRYPEGAPPASERFRADSEDFLSQLLPHLMRRLPDWPSVERAGPSAD